MHEEFSGAPDTLVDLPHRFCMFGPEMPDGPLKPEGSETGDDVAGLGLCGNQPVRRVH